MSSQNNQFFAAETVAPEYAAQVAKALLPGVISTINELNKKEVEEAVQLMKTSITASFDAAKCQMTTGLLETLEYAGMGASCLGVAGAAKNAASETTRLTTDIKSFDTKIKELETELHPAQGILGQGGLRSEDQINGDLAKVKAQKQEAELAQKSVKKRYEESSSKRQSLQYFSPMLMKTLEKQQEASSTINSQAVSRQMDTAQSGLESVKQGNQQTKEQVLQTVQRLAQAQVPLSQKG